jgi:hypothetical protein
MKLMLLIAGLLISAVTQAEVFKCTDSSGKTVYRAGPCAPGQGNIQINLKTGASTDMNDQMQQEKIQNQENLAKQEQEKQEQKLQEQRIAKLKQDARDESAKNQFVIKNNPKLYSPFAIPPYDLEELPPLVKGYGNKLPEIERFRRIAAEKALTSDQCGRVEAAELNIKSTSDSLVFLIDCSSGQKFYFNEQELKP